MDIQQIQAIILVQSQKIEDFTIVAPMDGVVLRRDGEIGEIAEAGQILFRIGVPKPELVDKAEVLKVLPHGSGTVEVCEGGLEIFNDAGTGSTVLAHAAAIVRLAV